MSFAGWQKKARVQTPPSPPPPHRYEQQSLPCPHDWPSTRQPPPDSGAHRPPVQVCVQHSPPVVHVWPTSLQAVAEQVPSVQLLLQQSLLTEQLAPAPEQKVEALQRPAWQVPPQQLVVLVQIAPDWEQLPPSGRITVPPAAPPVPPVPPPTPEPAVPPPVPVMPPVPVPPAPPSVLTGPGQLQPAMLPTSTAAMTTRNGVMALPFRPAARLCAKLPCATF